jgi:DNA-binding MarR family transcriptional regulator
MKPSKRDAAPPDQQPQQARTLGFLLREVYGQLQQQVYAAVASAGHAGLRPAHSPVLRHLPAGGGRVADLARATGLAKQSVSYVIEDLVAQGYLKVTPDPEDGRARRILYTPRGQRLLEALVDASAAAENQLARRLGVRRVESLRAILESALADEGSGQPGE